MNNDDENQQSPHTFSDSINSSVSKSPMLMGSYGKPPTSNEKKKIPVPERYRKRRLAKLERMKQKEIEQARRSALQLNPALKNEKTKPIPNRKLRRIARN